MRTKDNIERVKRLMDEVVGLGRNPADYRYDLNTWNAYRIEQTKLGSYVYILINDKKHGKEAKVDLSDFYVYRLYSYRWSQLKSNPKKDYPHTNTYDCNGKKINLLLHVLIMGAVKGKVIDHNDGDHYNASRSNLNHVTTAQNNRNRHPNLYNKVTVKPVASTQTTYVPLFA